VGSDLLQFFDDVISDGIEWGGTKQKQICHRIQGGKIQSTAKNFKNIDPKKKAGIGGRGGKKKGILLLCLILSGKTTRRKKAILHPDCLEIPSFENLFLSARQFF